ncbi:AfsR/SARP family transcriptional regulator [Streptomyces mirabilis]|uniref:AfsR/SARP family transcriptional regulator n=1 Tax=Streptomyces mirabilis TaxID=68239 RepID=UPI0036EC46EB
MWAEEPPDSGRKILAPYVYELRKALDGKGAGPEHSVIRTGMDSYLFVADGLHLDVADLAELADAAQHAKASGDPATALDRYTEALDLFRGEPLAGLPGPFAQVERERLAERRRTLQRERLECLVLLGRSADALDELARLSVSAPLNESVLALRMRALYGSGRQAEALNAYQDMRERLSDELGIDPGEELRQTYDAVLHQDDARLLGPAPERSAARAAHARPTRRAVNDLPGDVGRLIGRDAELAQLVAPSSAPGSVTIVTVDGTAGVGKTVLVVRAARELNDGYPDGCLFVDLRAHSTQRRQSPERVLQRLLRSLGAAKGELPSDLEELTAAWRAATSSLRLLLVLDDAWTQAKYGRCCPRDREAGCWWLVGDGWRNWTPTDGSLWSLWEAGTRCHSSRTSSERSARAKIRRRRIGWPNSATGCRWPCASPGRGCRTGAPGRWRTW